MPRPSRSSPQLTRRQAQVVRLTSLGCSSLEVAAILKITENTVNNHKAAAMKVLGTDRSVLLTRLAIKRGYSSASETLSRREKKLCGRKDDGWN